MKNKLLILDLDGTLVDTLPSIHEAINLCFCDIGLETKTRDEVRRAVGNGVDALLLTLLPRELGENAERFAEIKRIFSARYRETQERLTDCYDGMLEALKQIKKDENTLAVLSNKPDELVQIIVKNIFDEGFISLAMGQTDLPKKPDPTAPRLIAERLGYSIEDTYFVGDSEVDVKTGKNAGMVTVAVSWGFRERRILEDAEPDAIIDTRDELLAYFKA